jgi:hypothetical protein
VENFYTEETRHCPNHPKLDYDGYENCFDFCPICGTKMIIKTAKVLCRSVKIPTKQEQIDAIGKYFKDIGNYPSLPEEGFIKKGDASHADNNK